MGEFYRKKLSIPSDSTPNTVLLAEGFTEAFFFDKILEVLGADKDKVFVFCLEGVDNLSSKCSLLYKQPGFASVKSVGFLVDADGDPQGRLMQIIDRSKKTMNKWGGLTANIFPNDSMYEEDGYKLGVWVSPGDAQNGAIEDIIMLEVNGSPVNECIQNLKKDMKKNGIDVNNKGLVQTYISCHNGSLCGQGRAFQAGILDVNHNAYEKIREWIVQLINQ